MHFSPAPSHIFQSFQLHIFQSFQLLIGYYHIENNVFYAADGFKMDYGGHDSVFRNNLVMVMYVSTHVHVGCKWNCRVSRSAFFSRRKISANVFPFFLLGLTMVRTASTLLDSINTMVMCMQTTRACKFCLNVRGFIWA